jgi:hypothetical protein
MLKSIKVRRYLTVDQISKGEQSDYSIKGSIPGLFGIENLLIASVAVLVGDEFDAMLLDQSAGDLAGAISFSKGVLSIGLADWNPAARYLLHIPNIIVPVTQEEEELIINNSLLNYSHRIYRSYLPDLPTIKGITNFRKAGINPREWLIQAINRLGLHTVEINDNISKPLTESHSFMELATKEKPNLSACGHSAGDIFPNQKSNTLYLNEPHIVDLTIMPKALCYCCNNDEYIQRHDGGWVCSTCHPKPDIS